MVDQIKRKKTTLRKFTFCLLLFLVFYIGSYLVLSFLGSYYPAKSGNHRLDMGWSFFDIEVWHPKIGYAQLYRKIDGSLTIHADWVGVFYCPLILLDQKFVHRTRMLDSIESNK